MSELTLVAIAVALIMGALGGFKLIHMIRQLTVATWEAQADISRLLIQMNDAQNKINVQAVLLDDARDIMKKQGDLIKELAENHPDVS